MPMPSQVTGIMIGDNRLDCMGGFQFLFFHQFSKHHNTMLNTKSAFSKLCIDIPNGVVAARTGGNDLLNTKTIERLYVVLSILLKYTDIAQIKGG